MIVSFISWIREHMRIVIPACYFVLALMIIIDMGIPRHHPHFLGDMIPGFWAGFGFFACVLIIILSKWLGKKFLFRPDNYYNTDASEENNG